MQTKLTVGDVTVTIEGPDLPHGSVVERVAFEAASWKQRYDALVAVILSEPGADASWADTATSEPERMLAYTKHRITQIAETVHLRRQSEANARLRVEADEQMNRWRTVAEATRKHYDALARMVVGFGTTIDIDDEHVRASIEAKAATHAQTQKRVRSQKFSQKKGR